MSEYYVNEIEVDGKLVLCFSDGRIYRMPHTAKDGRKLRGRWAIPDLHSNGYPVVSIAGRVHFVHRLLTKAFLKDYSESLTTDHIDGDRKNNNVSNLRMVTRLQNNRAYKRVTLRNSSQYRGVSWHKDKKKFRARIEINKKQHFLGYFKCEHEAARAYNKAATELGFFPEALNVIKS